MLLRWAHDIPNTFRVFSSVVMCELRSMSCPRSSLSISGERKVFWSLPYMCACFHVNRLVKEDCKVQPLGLQWVVEWFRTFMNIYVFEYERWKSFSDGWPKLLKVLIHQQKVDSGKHFGSSSKNLNGYEVNIFCYKISALF